MLFLLFFCIELLAIYFVSRLLTNELYFFFRKITKNTKTSYILLTIIFLPGTIIHELSHYLTAFFLHLRVLDITVWPQFQNNSIKLGSVRYEKKDFFRGFLVGIAPLVVGIVIFYLFFQLSLFPSPIFLINVPIVYFLFILSITMFSSKQDMVDFIYLIPLLLFISLIVYIFNIDLSILFRDSKINGILLHFITNLQQYFFYIAIAAVSMVGVFKAINKTIKL